MAIQTPFETTEDGLYRVTQPLEGAKPDSIQLTLDGSTYRLSEYRGRDVLSRVNPDILVYANCDVITDE